MYTITPPSSFLGFCQLLTLSLYFPNLQLHQHPISPAELKIEAGVKNPDYSTLSRHY